MGDVIPFPRERRAVVTLARLSGDLDPGSWPVDDLGLEGITAAALLADRVDVLPAALADPVIAWGTLPEPIRAVVHDRNPDMASFCARWAGGKP
jgi:hypothetical protein